ncbi:hypothetical protein [Lacinutrix himadriensis]|uniref:hypothetical protein n=1 Tax=Lacinutrix himadriensis TaxID=641549 RepID=UPI0006E2A2BA|nr:hypothetical protein [Lacinutrix himadriensis]
MKVNNLVKLIKQDYLLLALCILSLFSILRTLIIPLQGDEITYFKISEHILSGKYYLYDFPSSVSPILPFIFAIFSTPFNYIIGISLLKCFNILLAFFGLNYMCLFLKKQNVPISIIASIFILTLTNTNSINWFSSLFPESILFFGFWGFVYYFNKELSVSHFKKMLLFFVLLTMTRYVFAVLGIAVLFYIYRCYKAETFKNNQIKKLVFFSILCAIPVLFWFKYVYYIEMSNVSEISYFKRYKEGNNGLWTNIKAGLGFMIHPEVRNLSGLPAFVTLFIPITGFRHYLISAILFGLFLFGYIKTNKSNGIQFLFYATLLVMLGLVFAGTGFSRYWLVFLPCYYLGFYYAFKTFKLKDSWFFLLSKIVAIIYVINEIRLDFLIFDRHL